MTAPKLPVINFDARLDLDAVKKDAEKAEKDSDKS